ncbi:MFS transporter [Parafrigoribacterium mesophilum]|uniref:MFS transporter n=1 Tax=Parafrigoribacterium mesophilum TaxID=433646 RepID=UPI0031FCCA84
MSLWAGRAMAFVGILLVALNLRTAVASISPIAASIAVDVPLSAVGLGLIGMVPPVAFAASGFVAAPAARRLGLERVLMLAILGMVVGLSMRAVAADYAVLLAGNVVALTGAGVGNILLPPLVKRYFPDRIGLLTSLYATVMSVSTAMPAGLAAPITAEVGWRASLGMWSVLALTSAIPWLVLLLQNRRQRSGLPQESDDLTPAPELLGAIWRSKLAWLLALVFSISGFHAYAMFAWLPKLLVQTAAVTPIQAGGLLSLFSLMGVPAALIVPILATRMKNVGILVHVGIAVFVLGYLGLLLAPAAAPILWVALIGSGPLIFPACLVLINLRSRTHQGAVALSGFVQAVGYAIGALGPLLIGFLHELTGGWTLPLLLLIGTALAGIATGVLLRKPVFVEDELRRRSVS